MNFMEKLQADYAGVEFESSCYETKEFASFARKCKTALKKECVAHGLELKKFSKGHFEVSAFLKAPTGKMCYLHIGDMRDGARAFGRVLYRTARDQRDFSGGMNHFAPLANVVEKVAQLCE